LAIHGLFLLASPIVGFAYASWRMVQRPQAGTKGCFVLS